MVQNQGTSDEMGEEGDEMDEMDDMISRQSVNDVLKELTKKASGRAAVFNSAYAYYRGAISDVYYGVKELPSVQSQRIKGKWIHKWSGDGSVWMEQRCSECGCVKEDEPVDYNYCPNCGADMRGTE